MPIILGPGTTKGVSPEAQAAAKKAAQLRKRSQHSSTKKSSGVGASGFYEGQREDRRNAARVAFISRLDATVMQARIIADELIGSDNRARTIAEYMITEFYVMSERASRNTTITFEDAKEQTIKDVTGLGTDTPGFLRYATGQALSALKGAHRVAVLGMDLDTVVAGIKRRNEEFIARKAKQPTNA